MSGAEHRVTDSLAAGVFVLINCLQDVGCDGELAAALEEEAIAAIQPSRLPGTIIWEEAVHRFAIMARSQMLTNDPALVTYEMSVSILRLVVFSTY